MKKLLCTLFLSSTVWALPLGNPAEPGFHDRGIFFNRECSASFCRMCDVFNLIGIEGGYYGDFVFDRKLQAELNADDQGTIRNTRLITNAGYLALTVCKRFEAFGTLGVSKFTLTTPSSTLGALSNLAVTYQTEAGFSWSAGGRVIALRFCNFVLGFEGQYFQTRPHLNWIESPLFDPVYFDQEDEREKLRYSEWQAGVGLAYHMSLMCDSLNLTPYIGFKGSCVRTTTNDVFVEFDPAVPSTAVTLFDLQNRERWGYAFGASLTSCKVWSVTVEARFLDETALAVISNFRF